MATQITLSTDQLSFMLSHRDYLTRDKQGFDPAYSVGNYVPEISAEDVTKLAALADKNFALLAYYGQMREKNQQLLSNVREMHGIVPEGDLLLASTELYDYHLAFIITPKADKFVLVIRDENRLPREANIMGRVISINRSYKSLYDPAGTGKYEALKGINYLELGFLETSDGFMTPEIANVMEDPVYREIHEDERLLPLQFVRKLPARHLIP